jgi:hypothetical protein
MSGHGTGWAQADLGLRRKWDPFKVRVAEESREKTTVTVAWMAQRLHKGTGGQLTHVLPWKGRNRWAATT